MINFTGSTSSGSKARAYRNVYEFGQTYVVKPKGNHEATIVWLHGLGDNGCTWSHILEALPLPNIKWICPSAPIRSMTLFGGQPSTAWFDVAGGAPDDVEGLDASTANVVNILSAELPGIKLAIGGFSMGAAVALHAATCYATGKYGNGDPFLANLSAVIGLSGWLPCPETLSYRLANSMTPNRAATFPILLCHGKVDDVVHFRLGEKSSELLTTTGFQDVTFKSFDELGHYTQPEQTHNLCGWLTSKLNLHGL